MSAAPPGAPDCLQLCDSSQLDRAIELVQAAFMLSGTDAPAGVQIALALSLLTTGLRRIDPADRPQVVRVLAADLTRRLTAMVNEQLPGRPPEEPPEEPIAGEEPAAAPKAASPRLH